MDRGIPPRNINLYIRRLLKNFWSLIHKHTLIESIKCLHMCIDHNLKHQYYSI